MSKAPIFSPSFLKQDQDVEWPGQVLRTDPAEHHRGQIVIDAVVPDCYARFPKPCVGGWGRSSLNISPAGRVLPCRRWPTSGKLRHFWHSAARIGCGSHAGLVPGAISTLGGCRCQAFMLTGDARAPQIPLSLDHALVAQLATERVDAEYQYRSL